MGPQTVGLTIYMEACWVTQMRYIGTVDWCRFDEVEYIKWLALFAQFSILIKEVREVAAVLGIHLQKPRTASRSQYRNAASAPSDGLEDLLQN